MALAATEKLHGIHFCLCSYKWKFVRRWEHRLNVREVKKTSPAKKQRPLASEIQLLLLSIRLNFICSIRCIRHMGRWNVQAMMRTWKYAREKISGPIRPNKAHTFEKSMQTEPEWLFGLDLLAIKTIRQTINLLKTAFVAGHLWAISYTCFV